MDSWIAWGYSNCGAEKDYARSKARIEAKIEQQPDALEPGYAYFYALEGDADKFMNFADRMIASKNVSIPYLQIFSLEHVGLAVTPQLLAGPRYLAAMAMLDFPTPENQ